MHVDIGMYVCGMFDRLCLRVSANMRSESSHGRHAPTYAHTSTHASAVRVCRHNLLPQSAAAAAAAGGSNKLFSNFEARLGPKRGASQPVGAVSFEPYGRRFDITLGNRVRGGGD